MNKPLKPGANASLVTQVADAVEASKAPAISRAAAVLRLLARSPIPLGVHPIARQLGLAPSTCMHVLRALVAEEFLSFNPETKLYNLDAGILTLAGEWLRRDRFSEAAQPFLDKVARSFGLTSFGVRITGLDHAVVVAVSQSGAPLQVVTHIGNRVPALGSAIGRVVGAFSAYHEDEIETRYRALGLEQQPDYDEWKAQVAEVRARGFAVDQGRNLVGVTVVAAPVWQATRDLSHGLVAVGLSSVLEADGLAALQQAIVDAARGVSAQLGGAPPP